MTRKGITDNILARNKTGKNGHMYGGKEKHRNVIGL